MIRLIIILFCLFAVSPCYSYNKVIIKDFNWKIYSTDNFDIHYYDDAESILPLLVKTLDNIYIQNTKDFNINLKDKTPFFIYVGHNDFEQTNITDIFEGTGGITEAFKFRLVVPHLGSKFWLEQVIRHEFTHVIEFNVLFSGFWRSAQIAAKFIFMPLWMMEGLAEYETGDLDKTNREMYLRDMMIPVNREKYGKTNKLIPLEKLHSFNHLKPHQVTVGYKQSNELIRFIADEYGKDKLIKILRAYKDKFEANTVLFETLGLNMKELNRRFEEYLEDKYMFIKDELQEPELYGKKVTNPEYFYSFNESPVFTKDDTGIIYITDRYGYNEIVRQNLLDGKIVSLVGNKHFNTVEYIESPNKALALSPDEKCLYFIGKKEQVNYIYRYEFKRKQAAVIDTGIKIIGSVDVTNDGKKLVFTGMQGGYNNIFMYDLESKILNKLTDTVDDISDAVISGDNKFIVYSKEKYNEASRKIYDRDLWKMDLSSGTNERLTGFDNDEFSPAISPDNKTVIFVSDRDDINNLYSLSLETGKISQLTSVVGGMFNPSYSHDGSKIIYSSYRNNEKDLYLMDIREKPEQPATQLMAFPKEPQLSLLNQVPSLNKQDNRKYRFSPTTDYIFPIFYYSSVGGLFALMNWQVSDMTGDNQLVMYTQYSGGTEFLDYQVDYIFSRYRPKFFVSFSGMGQFLYYNQEIADVENLYRISQRQVAGVQYPLNRYNSISLSIANAQDKWELRDSNNNGLYSYINNANLIGVSYLLDTRNGKYLEITSGNKLELTYETAVNAFATNISYDYYSIELNNYFPVSLTGKGQVVADRIMYASSNGDNRYTFRAFGYDRARIMPTDRLKLYKNNLMFANLEYRFPIVKDVNYHMWYMFPDFFFKTFYGILFADAGLAWNEQSEFTGENAEYSVGTGIRMHSFLLQMFPLSINMYVSYSPVSKQNEFYFMFGQTF